MQPSGERKVIISFRLEHLLGWGLTTLLCIIPAIMWGQIHPIAQIRGFAGIMLNLGRVTGLVGLVMYALNLVYATRLRFLESLFGGLNRVYIAHHLLGGLALVLLSFHPVLLSLRYVQVSLKQAALLLLPNGLTPIGSLLNTNATDHLLVLEQWALLFGIIAFWGMVVLLLVTFFIKIPYRIWIITHRFLGAAFFFAGLHILFITSDVSTHAALKYYILGFTALGLLAFCYKTLAGKILIRKYRYEISNVETVGGNVAQINMRPLGRPMMYKSGQFVFIRFLHAHELGISQEWHPFSISSGQHDDTLSLSIKGLGDFTNKLSSLTVGTQAEVEGAYGKFTYSNYRNLNQIWVAGGIGVTPFISMARSLPPTGFRIDLYYSVKTVSEVIDWQSLVDVASLTKGYFRVIPYIGDQQPGHLTADFIEKTSGGVTGKEIFICGPPGMMSALRSQFRHKQIPNTSIHTEEFAMS
jgi:predicted ferric reductase